jgi:hypothetical protein
MENNEATPFDSWLNGLSNSFQKALTPFKETWQYEVSTLRAPGPRFLVRIAIIWDILKTLPVHLFSLFVGYMLLLKMEQGRDFFTMLKHPFKYIGEEGWSTALHFLFFWIAIVLWSLFLWFSARIMLQMLKKTSTFIPDNQVFDNNQQEKINGYLLYWNRWIPRMLGVFPFVITFIGFAGEGAMGPLTIFLATAGFGFIFVVTRAKLWGNKNSDQERFGKQQKSLNDLHKMDKIKLKSFSAFSLFLGLLCCFSTGILAQIGSAAIAVSSFAVFIAWASVLSFWQQKSGVPIFLFALLIALVSSQYNNNHYIIPLEETPTSRQTLDAQFKYWLSQRIETDKIYSGDSTKDQYLYLIANEGGGIRGVDWTARVLRLLEKKDSSFYKKIFAMTGASGGMVGAAFYQSYKYGCDNNLINAADASKFDELLTRDYLSNELAAYLFPEFIQYIIPWAMPSVDRAKWFEDGIEAGFEDICVDDLTDKQRAFIQKPFLSMYPENDRYKYPSLLINGAVVETGQRAIYSNIQIEEQYFPNTLDIHSTLQHDVPISTAMTFCCRFPYVLPPATLRNAAGENKANIVDGGYFENTGIKTCLEILAYLKSDTVAPLLHKYRIRPVILFIKNSSTDVYQVNPAMPKPEQYSDFLLDWLAPPKCLINQWSGISINWIDEAIKRSQQDKDFEFYMLALNRNVDIRIPLGWCMSNDADREIKRQINDLDLEQVNYNQIVETDNMITLCNLLRKSGTSPMTASYQKMPKNSRDSLGKSTW